MKCFIVIKIVKEIKFEELLDKLDAKKCFQRQSFPRKFETNSSFHVK